jgi:glycosyltransferase involved in cell wall biosynthesis
MFMVRVLHVMRELSYSGVEVMLASAAASWRAAGIDGEIVATGEQPGPYASTLRDAGYRVHHLPSQRTLAFFLELRRLVKRGDFDVVHLHAEHASFWIALTARSAGPAVVRTVQNMFAYEGWLRTRRALQRRLARALGVRMVAASASVAENEAVRLDNPVSVVPNWVDTSRFRPPTDRERLEARARFGVPEDATAIVTVGNCSRVKNHGAVIRAVAAIDAEASLVYLHAGQEDEPASERALAAQLGVLDKCRFLGRVDDVPALLWSSDIYAMPSLHEGLSVASMEGLATGLLAVLADTPGLRDLRSAGAAAEAIVWVDPDPTSVRGGLERAVDLAGQLGAEERIAVHEAVDEHFGVETGVRRYANLYLARGNAGDSS